MTLHEALKPSAPNRPIRIIDNATGKVLVASSKGNIEDSLLYRAYYADCEVVKHEHVKEHHFLPILVLYIQTTEE